MVVGLASIETARVRASYLPIVSQVALEDLKVKMPIRLVHAIVERDLHQILDILCVTLTFSMSASHCPCD
jgi:hypothetical protein